MIGLDDVWDLVKREVALIDRTRVRENALHGLNDWLALFARRFGHLAQAAGATNSQWWLEELVKLAATAIVAARLSPQTPSQPALDVDGLIEVAGVEGLRPRIADKVAGPPTDAVLVARDVECAWVGGGLVWVQKAPEKK